MLNPPTTRGNALLSAQISTEPQIQKSQKFKKTKIKKSKLFLQDSVDVKNFEFSIFLDLGFWILGFLGFWTFEFWIFGWLYSGSLELWISGHQELYFRVPQGAGLDNTTVSLSLSLYICTIYTYIHIYVHEHTHTTGQTWLLQWRKDIWQTE